MWQSMYSKVAGLELREGNSLCSQLSVRSFSGSAKLRDLKSIEQPRERVKREHERTVVLQEATT